VNNLPTVVTRKRNGRNSNPLYVQRSTHYTPGHILSNDMAFNLVIFVHHIRTAHDDKMKLVTLNRVTQIIVSKFKLRKTGGNVDYQISKTG